MNWPAASSREDKEDRWPRATAGLEGATRCCVELECSSGSQVQGHQSPRKDDLAICGRNPAGAYKIDLLSISMRSVGPSASINDKNPAATSKSPSTRHRTERPSKPIAVVSSAGPPPIGCLTANGLMFFRPDCLDKHRHNPGLASRASRLRWHEINSPLHASNFDGLPSPVDAPVRTGGPPSTSDGRSWEVCDCRLDCLAKHAGFHAQIGMQLLHSAGDFVGIEFDAALRRHCINDLVDYAIFARELR